MKIAIPAETLPDETRVAATPASVRDYVKLGLDVVVQAGAGARSFLSDAEYEEAGAFIAPNAEKTVAEADVVLTVRRPQVALVEAMKEGAALIGMLDPWSDGGFFEKVNARRITAFAMELIPRITRAQSMDVLSSQASLAGYRAVIEATYLFSRIFPMMMTAAGTIPPAKVFVMGAGVAGLQAIATAHRLGAAVSATDVRPEAGEQVRSLGAKFVFLEELAAAGEGGYAKELTEEQKKLQAELVANHIKDMDVVITTANIPGRPAPRLVTLEMVESMRPGSIIVDLAVERGGNCELSRPGEVVEHEGVKIVGYTNMAGRVPGNASAMYANNLRNFLKLLLAEDASALNIDPEDEIIAGTLVTRDGEIVHPVLKNEG
jgi:NAD(P) transhydrogenase subunit alpha